MLNIPSVLAGLLALAGFAQIDLPYLGWTRQVWLALLLIGVCLGQLSAESKAGRNLNILVLIGIIARKYLLP